MTRSTRKDFTPAQKRTLGRNCRAAREHLKLTLDEAEALTGVDGSSISGFENAHRSPALTSILKLARGYGVNVDALVADIDPAYTAHATRVPPGLLLTEDVIATAKRLAQARRVDPSGYRLLEGMLADVLRLREPAPSVETPPAPRRSRRRNSEAGAQHKLENKQRKTKC